MSDRFLLAIYDEKGGRRRFPAEAERYWRERAAVIGAVLRAEQAMTLPEIVDDCLTYALEHPEGIPYPETEVAYVAQTLARLWKWDMVRLV